MKDFKSITVATGMLPGGPSNFLANCADCVGRNTPLLLLNSLDHSSQVAPTMEQAMKHLKGLDEEMNKLGTFNFLYTSQWALLHWVDGHFH